MTATGIAAATGLAVAFGISPYATVALLGLTHRFALGGTLPASVDVLANPWVMTISLALTAVEFAATLIPGIASAWEAVHVTVRPPLAAVLAAAIVWGSSPGVVLAAALLAGVVAFGTSPTKLGARLAIDTSPEPVSNGAAGMAELALISLIVLFVWRRPEVVASAALAIVATSALLVRTVWGMIWKTVVRTRRPGVRSLRS